jgi:mono/diheme cytochrome c family protein
MPLAAPLVLAIQMSNIGPDPGLQARVKELFDESCVMCHDAGIDPTGPDGVDLESDLMGLLQKKSNVTGEPMVVPGDPDKSYLLKKMTGQGEIKGETMPLGEDILPADQLDIVREWIASLPADAATTPLEDGDGPPDGRDGTTRKKKGRPAFYGTNQIALPSTTTLGKRTLQYRIDHRFGRIGTERGALGMDAGVVQMMGLQYGILDGWDVQVRRTNSRKTWEIGTKYVPLRQEDGRPVSFGGYFDFAGMRDFDIKNRFVGDFQLMLSRMWFDRWATMVTVGYHLFTNHNSRVFIDYGDGAGAVPVRDRRGTMTMGFASTVLLDKRKRWGIDMEWVLPVPASGGTPDPFYFRGGDADPGGTRLGAWSLGGSLKTAKHFFQVFFTNNREIASNLYAPGGQTKNPFKTPGVDEKNPFLEFNFYLGFNLARSFSL